MITDHRGFNVSDVEMQAAEQQAAGWAQIERSLHAAQLFNCSMFAAEATTTFLYRLFISQLSCSMASRSGCRVNGAAFLLTLSLRQHQVPEERINISAFFAHFSLHASYLNVGLKYLLLFARTFAVSRLTAMVWFSSKAFLCLNWIIFPFHLVWNAFFAPRSSTSVSAEACDFTELKRIRMAIVFLCCRSRLCFNVASL